MIRRTTLSPCLTHSTAGPPDPPAAAAACFWPLTCALSGSCAAVADAREDNVLAETWARPERKGFIEINLSCFFHYSVPAIGPGLATTGFALAASSAGLVFSFERTTVRLSVTRWFASDSGG
jgi:hypothetical protein